MAASVMRVELSIPRTEVGIAMASFCLGASLYRVVAVAAFARLLALLARAVTIERRAMLVVVATAADLLLLVAIPTSRGATRLMRGCFRRAVNRDMVVNGITLLILAELCACFLVDFDFL